MIEELFRTVGIGLALAMLLLSVRKTEPDLAMGIRIAAGILLAGTVLVSIQPVISAIQVFFAQTGQSGDTVKILLKALGVCILVQFAADSCRDAGESALAGRIEFAGRVVLTIMAVPVLTELLEIAVELIGT